MLTKTEPSRSLAAGDGLARGRRTVHARGVERKDVDLHRQVSDGTQYSRCERRRRFLTYPAKLLRKHT